MGNRYFAESADQRSGHGLAYGLHGLSGYGLYCGLRGLQYGTGLPAGRMDQSVPGRQSVDDGGGRRDDQQQPVRTRELGLPGVSAGGLLGHGGLDGFGGLAGDSSVR